MSLPEDLQQLESQRRRDILKEAESSLFQMVTGTANTLAGKVVSALSSFDVLPGAAAESEEIFAADESEPDATVEPAPEALPEQQDVGDKMAPHSGEIVERTPEEREENIRAVREDAERRFAALPDTAHLDVLAPPPVDIGNEGGHKFSQPKGREQDQLFGLATDALAAVGEGQEMLQDLLRTMTQMLIRHNSALEELQDRLDSEDEEDVF